MGDGHREHDHPTLVRGYVAQIHPVFMLPPIAATGFGAILADIVAPLNAGIHVLAIGLAVYTAHLKDGYVDFYLRGEDDSTELSAAAFRAGIWITATAFGACLVGLYAVAGPLAVMLTAPTWAIGYLHAPYLDTNPVTTTLGYPVGIGLAVLGGHAAQGLALTVETLALSSVLVVLLSGIKIVDDLQDYDWDRRHGKQTVGVSLGISQANYLARVLMGSAMIGVLGFAGAGYLPRGSVLSVIAFAPVAAIAWRRDPRIQTMLLIRGSYLFFAVLIGVTWFELP